MKHSHFLVPPGKKIRLKDYDPGFTGRYKTEEEASAKLRKDVDRLAKYQNVLYAQNTYALLVILQAMDTAGKDGTIRHVMSGVNPQGTQVHSFKAPSAEELDHDFLWRSVNALPERAGSEFPTARTTKRCWSSAFTRRFWMCKDCRPERRERASGSIVTTRSTILRGI